MTTSTRFGAEIPANKFYPPGIDASRCLFRRELVEEVLLKHGRTKQAIAIEAQAGQGKTTLIVQYLSRIDVPYAWYQAGSEDGDPLFLLKALLVCIKGVLPKFSSPLVQKIITAGEVSPLDLPKLASLLMSDLNTCQTDDFYIVFDDMHLLKGHDASLSLIEHLFETAQSKIHFIFSSREPVAPVGERPKASKKKLLIL